MVKLLASSSIRVLPIRPTVVKSITPAEIKIMRIIWSALNLSDKVFFECFVERRCVLINLHGICAKTALHMPPPEGISPIRTHGPLSSFSVFLPFQHNPNRSSRHADRDTIGQHSTNEACRREGRKNGSSMLRAVEAWTIQLRPAVLCHDQRV